MAQAGESFSLPASVDISLRRKHGERVLMKNAQPQFNKEAANRRSKKLRVEWLGGERFRLSLGGETGFRPGRQNERGSDSHRQLVIFVPDGGSDHSTVWMRRLSPGSESSVEARRKPARASSPGE